MLSRPETSNTQRGDSLRQRCRNPRCRGKLKLPTYNVRDAFCCRGCFTGFYRSRCLVCEEPIVRKTEGQRLCQRPKCRNEFRRDRARFHSVRYPVMPPSQTSTPKVPVKRALLWPILRTGHGALLPVRTSPRSTSGSRSIPSSLTG